MPFLFQTQPALFGICGDMFSFSLQLTWSYKRKGGHLYPDQTNGILFTQGPMMWDSFQIEN